MIRSFFFILAVLVFFSCVNNNHHTTVVVDSENDSTLITCSDSVVVIREIIHDTIYIKEKDGSKKSANLSISNTPQSKRQTNPDPFIERIPKFD